MVRHVHHLVGVAEIADLLGISRQRVHQLAAEPGFPKPEVILTAGTVWKTAEVIAWAKAQGREVD